MPRLRPRSRPSSANIGSRPTASTKGQSARALLRVQHQRSEAKRKPKRSKATLRTLIDDVRRHDAATDRAWERLAAYRRRRAGARRPRAATTGGLAASWPSLTAVLRIEQDLKALVAVERRELALQEGEGDAAYASGSVRT